MNLEILGGREREKESDLGGGGVGFGVEERSQK